MKSKVTRKITALFVTLCMLPAIAPASLAASGYDAEITDVAIEDGIVVSADITVNTAGTYTAYAAVYTDNVLVNVDSAEVTASGTVDFNGGISFDAETQTLKCFVWDENMKPAAEIYEIEAEGFTATFLKADSGVESIDVYYTQDYTTEDETDAYETVARSGDTGEIAADGTGQVNFKVNLADGYEITSITATDGTYNKVKKVAANTYRVTKITADTTIAIATAQSSGITAYTATFNTDEHVASITVSETDSFDEASLLTDNAANAAARDGDGGFILTDGNGQINFVVNVEEGYQIASVTVDGNYKNLKQPAETGVTNGYRITKVKGDLTINVTTEVIPEETGDGVIHLNGTSIDATGVENVTVSGTTATITAAGEYTVTGTLNDGQIAVASTVGKKDAVKITLEDVSVTNSAGSAFDAENGKITLITDTDNTFVTTAADAAAVYSKKDLTIQGGGSVTAKSTNGNGIHCKKDLKIADVDVTVEAGNNGIKGNQSVTVADTAGVIKVTAVKDGICSDQAPEIDTQTGAFDADSIVDKGGAVTINGGTLDITTTGTTKTGDGIQADTLLTIAGGDITINATGEALKANFSQYDVTDATDYDTNEDTVADYNGCIVIAGGTITATAGEDGIKAVKDITISGGDTTITSAGDEGIQVSEIVYSNENETAVSDYVEGSINITDGNVTVTKSTGDAIQCGTGDVNISEGTVTVKASGDEGIQAGKVEICTDSSTPVFYDLNGDVNISGGTVNIASDSDGITAVGTYRQTGSPVVTIVAGSSSSSASCDGIQAGKAYTHYEVYGSGDDDTNIHETIGVVDIEGGTLNVKACGGAYDSIKASGDSNGTKKDFSCKGIKARSLIDISGGTVNADSYDDAFHSAHTMNVSGGNITANSCDDGIHADFFLNVTNGTINVTKGYEGLEAAEIDIQGGDVKTNVYDDGLNASGKSSEISGKTAYTLSNVSSSYSASSIVTLSSSEIQIMEGPGGSSGGRPGGDGGQGGWGGGGDSTSSDYGKLYIKGGNLYVITEYGDGIDSNGTLAVSGGVTVVDASTLGGGDSDGLDAESISITGGYVITMSMGGMESAGTFSQKSVIYGSWSSGGGPGGSSSGSGLSAGNYVITDSSGNILCAFKRTSGSIARVLFSSPKLLSGTYYLKSMSGSAALTNGLYGAVNSSYVFTASSGVSAGSTSYTMTTK